MSRFDRAVVLGTTALVLLGWPSAPALACSVCLAGDPVYNAQGTTVQQAGDFSVYFQVMGWEKTSGHPPEEGEEEGHEVEENKSQRLDLFVSWTPIDRLTLTVDVPWALNEITEFEDGDASTSRISGLGDVALQISGVLWRNRDVLPSTWIEGRAFVEFPTGQSRQKRDGVRDPHLQAGTGSWDYGFGLAGIHRLSWGSLYSSVSYRVNTLGSLHYEYGDVVLANAAVQVPLGHALGLPDLEPFSVGFELNYRFSQYDRDHGSRYEDSGGSILYLTPSLRIRLPWCGDRNAPVLATSVQIPTTSSWLYGVQNEDAIWNVGLQYTF